MASFWEDLVELRKQHQFTVREMYDATRIPVDVIEEIESGFIFSEQCTRNKTYIRSFVRTYAKALKIDTNDVSHALDLVDANAYDGFLLKKYRVNLSGKSPLVKPDILEESKPKNEPKPPVIRVEESKTPVKNPGTVVDYENEYSRPDPSRPHNQGTPPPPKIESVNWADMGKKFSNLPSGQSFPIIIVVVVIVAVIAVYFGMKFFSDDEEAVPQASQEVVTSLPEPEVLAPPEAEDLETVENEAPDSTVVMAPAPPSQNFTLPDTLEILVWAKFEKLEPVRVRTDVTGIINPYWIEQGDAMRFVFTKNIYLRGQFGRMSLIFNGHEFNDFNPYKREDGSVILEREFFNKEPYLNPVDLDELEEKPDNLINRPIFKTE